MGVVMLKPILIGAVAGAVMCISGLAALSINAQPTDPMSSYERVMASARQNVQTELESDPDYRHCEQQLDTGDVDMVNAVNDAAKNPFVGPANARNFALEACMAGAKDDRRQKDYP